MIRALPAVHVLPWNLVYRALWWGALFGVMFLAVGIALTGYRMDAAMYWGATHLPADQLYSGTWNGGGFAYVYSPAFVQAISPLGLLPFGIFYALWIGLEVGALLWMTGPLIALPLLLYGPIQEEVLSGNVHLLLAAAVVLSLRYPAAWAFVLLTKVTPAVGLLWYAMRREWRALLIVAGATGAIVLASVLIGGPGLWGEWAMRLMASPGSAIVPLWPRVLAAAVVVTFGAYQNWPWTLGVAAGLAVPNFALGSLALATFVAVIGIVRRPALLTACRVSTP